METAKESIAATPAANAGLRGVVAASSKIGDVNGEQGILIYQGYNIHDLAANSTFEEVVYLLWNERLPTQNELDAFCGEFRAHYAIPDEIATMMKAFPKDAQPMDVLRTTVSALAFFDTECAHKTDRENAVKASIKLTAQFPALVAAWERIRRGKEVVAPLPDQSIAYNFMYQLKGETPDPEEVRMMDVCLILHADHELNASTFATRVASGTLADVYGAVVAGIATLAGPLHGGANTAVMNMLIEIGSVENVEPWLENALANKRKIMGIGHAVYKTEDPRATVLRRFSKRMAEKTGITQWYDMSEKIEKLMLEKKGMHPNVDFYSASAYYLMDIPTDQYTPIFAVSRVSGWTGHILEQYGNNKLIRPRAEYVGARDLKYVPIGDR